MKINIHPAYEVKKKIQKSSFFVCHSADYVCSHIKNHIEKTTHTKSLVSPGDQEYQNNKKNIEKKLQSDMPCHASVFPHKSCNFIVHGF